MASFNVSADDSSPLILYGPAGAWTDAPSNDTSAPSYFQQSRHTSSSNGASATIQFSGTGIWFFGAKMPTYGPYNISIDGQSVAGNAHSQNASFQQLLGGQSGLTNGSHTAVITNTGTNSLIDLDWVVFETQIGSANSTITATTIDDSSPAIAYLPTPADWSADPAQGSFNNTLHYTQTGGAQAQFAFNGEAVAIFGTVSPDQANYTVTMDGFTELFQGGSDGLASHLHLKTLLYFADNLTSGPHNVTLTANPAQSGQNNTGKFTGIDRIVVLSTSNGSTTENVSGNMANPMGTFQGISGPPRTSRLNMPVIEGAIVVTLVLLLLTLLAIVLYRRRGDNKGGRLRLKFSIRQPKTPSLPMQVAPPWGLSPRTPDIPNFYSDPSHLEKGVTHPASTGPQEENPFIDDARGKLPTVPEMSKVLYGNSDCRTGKREVTCYARPPVPIRSARPPTLDLSPTS